MVSGICASPALILVGRTESTQHSFPSNSLGWHVCRTKFARHNFFELRNLSRKMLRNFPRNFRAFILVGPKKIPPSFLPNCPAKDQEKFTDELLQPRRENNSIFDVTHIKKYAALHVGKYLRNGCWFNGTGTNAISICLVAVGITRIAACS